METISLEEFKKVDIRVGEIMSAEKIAGSEKLLKLKVNFGSAVAHGSGETKDERQVLSGVAKFFPDPAALVGKRCLFVTNLAPRKMMGLESQAMLVAVGGDPVPGSAGEYTPFSLFETTAAPGSRVH